MSCSAVNGSDCCSRKTLRQDATCELRRNDDNYALKIQEQENAPSSIQLQAVRFLLTLAGCCNLTTSFCSPATPQFSNGSYSVRQLWILSIHHDDLDQFLSACQNFCSCIATACHHFCGASVTGLPRTYFNTGRNPIASFCVTQPKLERNALPTVGLHPEIVHCLSQFPTHAWLHCFGVLVWQSNVDITHRISMEVSTTHVCDGNQEKVFLTRNTECFQRRCCREDRINTFVAHFRTHQTRAVTWGFVASIVGIHLRANWVASCSRPCPLLRWKTRAHPCLTNTVCPFDEQL